MLLTLLLIPSLLACTRHLLRLLLRNEGLGDLLSFRSLYLLISRLTGRGLSCPNVHMLIRCGGCFATFQVQLLCKYVIKRVGLRLRLDCTPFRLTLLCGHLQASCQSGMHSSRIRVRRARER